MAFMTIMIKVHTFPLFAIRPMYLAMRWGDMESRSEFAVVHFFLFLWESEVIEPFPCGIAPKTSFLFPFFPLRTFHQLDRVDIFAFFPQADVSCCVWPLLLFLKVTHGNKYLSLFIASVYHSMIVRPIRRSLNAHTKNKKVFSNPKKATFASKITKKDLQETHCV